MEHITVELVKQYAAVTGRYIHMATKVTIDGRSVTFTERLPKGKAIAAARYELGKSDAAANLEVGVQ